MPRIDTLALALFPASLMILAACVRMEQARRPSLHEVRLGNVQGQAAEDMRLSAREISGEVTE